MNLTFVICFHLTEATLIVIQRGFAIHPSVPYRPSVFRD